ncbi:DC-STAMP domain-containing protein 2-like [Haliotis cracherodii]|uniref:DC-STAMP domain-containing protein 2-like n=1 Tax=Haliotis cracherodii TaxID=6455 RepID=UPI0039E8428C
METITKNEDSGALRAKHSYNPRYHDELALTVGDEITDIKDVGNGWVVGHNNTTGNTGLCPREYLHSPCRKSTMVKIMHRVSSIYTHMAQNVMTPKRSDQMALTTLGGSSDTLDIEMHSNNVPEKKMSVVQVFFRVMCGILSSLFLGCLIFAALLYIYSFTLIQSGAIAGGITLLMGMFLIFSPYVRCVAALMSVSVFTSQGRAAILTLIPGLLLSGPIMNMQRNINEGSTSIGCVAEVVMNQTLALHNQILDSVTLQRENLENAVKEAENLTFTSTGSDLNTTDGQTTPTHSNESVVECLSRIDQMKERCTNLTKYKPNITAIKLPCRKILGKKCKEVETSTLKTNTLCASLTGMEELCYPSSRPRRSISAIRNRFKGFSDMFNVRLNSTKLVDVRGNTSFSLVQKIEDIKKEVQRKMDKVVHVFGIINKLLIIFVLLAFISAGMYLRRFLRKIKFDNIYITSELKSLDKQLRATGKQNAVLPLLKREKRKYINSTSPKLVDSESFAWKVGMSQVVLHIIIATIILLLDYGIFYILILVKENGGVDIAYSGGATLAVEVEGSQPIAVFFKTILESLSTSNTFNNTFSFEQCLPEASEAPRNNLYMILTLYTLVILFVLLQSYGLRLRRKIAAFFFPEREMERVSFLCRHILLKRKMRSAERNTNSLKEWRHWLSRK